MDVKTKSPGSEDIRSIAVVGVRGGVGASTFASNFSAVLSRLQKVQACLVDMDFHLGSLALINNQPEQTGLLQALGHVETLDEKSLKHCTQTLDSNLDLLSGHLLFDHEINWNKDSMATLLHFLLQCYDVCVADISAQNLIENPNLVKVFSHVMLITPLTVLGLRDTQRLLDWIRSYHSTIHCEVVASEIYGSKQNELTKKAFSKELGQSISFSLPRVHDGMTSAAMKGMLLAQQKHRHPYVKNLNRYIHHQWRGKKVSLVPNLWKRLWKL